jgi:hypothetical protein
LKTRDGITRSAYKQNGQSNDVLRNECEKGIEGDIFPCCSRELSASSGVPRSMESGIERKTMWKSVTNASIKNEGNRKLLRLSI